MPSRPLEGIRVLDLGQQIPGPFCAKVLGAMGADVIKAEPVDGDPARLAGPFPGDVPHSERSGLFIYLNTGKRGITLDFRTATGRDLLLRLAAWADVVVENFAPRALPSLGLGYEALKAANPRLVLVSITPFGQSGPYRDFRATEAGLHAISGEMSVAGQPRLPLKKGGEIADYLGGLNGFLGAMAALLSREETGQGEHVDVSLSEGLSSIFGGYTRQYAYSGKNPQRREEARWPQLIRPAKDGYVMTFTRGGSNWWRDFAELIGDPGFAQEPKAPPEVRAQKDAEMEARLSTWIKERTTEEVYHAGQNRRQAFGIVSAAPDILASPQLAHRRYFEEVQHPEAGALRLMGLPFLADDERWPQGISPSLGQHNQAVYCEMLGLSQQELVLLRQTGVI